MYTLVERFLDYSKLEQTFFLPENSAEKMTLMLLTDYKESQLSLTETILHWHESETTMCNQSSSVVG